METKKYQALFQIQFLQGCDCIICHNKHCRNCADFKHRRLSRSELIEMSRYYAVTEKLHRYLCNNLPITITNPSIKKRLNDFTAWAKKFVSTEVNEDDGNDSNIDFPTAILAINGISDIFPFALLSNDKSLSDTNSAIDEELITKLTNRLSAHPEVVGALTALVFSNVEMLNTKKLNYFSSIRAFVLMFAFPQIYDIAFLDDVLERLVSLLASTGPENRRIVEYFFTSNPKLLSSAVSACHFSISHYFSQTFSNEVHDKHTFECCKAIGVLYSANLDCEKGQPSSLFYDYHINQRIKPEMELKIDPKQSLLQFPFVLSLQTKYNLCRSQSVEIMSSLANSTYTPGALTLKITITGNIDPCFTIHVRRDHLIEDAVSQIKGQNPMFYLKMIKVIFEGEPAVDVGGSSREFFYLLSDKLFSNDFGLFSTVENSQYVWFNQNFSMDRISSYQFAGIIVGLAVYNSILLPVRFPRILYKKILCPEQPITLQDFAEVDAQAASSLYYMMMMRSKGHDIMQLDLTFDVTVSSKQTIPLRKGSEGLEVNNSNLEEYIQEYVFYYLFTYIQQPFEAFSKGFKMVCRASAYSMLDPSELSILVSGEEAMDWQALKANCTYTGGYSSESHFIKWFWEIFDGDFSNDEKKMFLKFVTGTDQSPLGGLGNVKMVIQKSEMIERFPVAHTCFNLLCLPAYPTKEEMLKKVKNAIKFSEGFSVV